jgi:hypothetical protein
VICQRTALISQARGLLAEYGIVLSKGPARLAAEGPDAVAAAPLSDLARELFAALFDQLRELETRVEAFGCAPRGDLSGGRSEPMPGDAAWCRTGDCHRAGSQRQ